MMLCPMQCGEQSGRWCLPWCPLVPDVLDCQGVVCDKQYLSLEEYGLEVGQVLSHASSSRRLMEWCLDPGS
jgi:hypothetical protein